MEQETRDQPATAIEVAPAESRAENGGIFLIAVFDLVKAGLFLVATAGVFHLIDRNTQVELTRLLHAFRFNGDHKFVRGLLRKADLITDPDKRILTGVLLLYTGMYAVEGVGLLLRKRWAEYFAVAMTAIPLPFEVYALLHHANHLQASNLLATDPSLPILLHSQVFVLKFALLIINVGIVCFLIYHLRHTATQGARKVVEELSPEDQVGGGAI